MRLNHCASRLQPNQDKQSFLSQFVFTVCIVLTGCSTIPEATLPSGKTNDSRTYRGYENPCTGGAKSEDEKVDQAQEMLFSLSCEAALWLDGLGGSQGDIDAAKRTHGYVESSIEYSEFDGFSSDAKMRVETELPVLQNRLRAFIGRESSDSYTRQRSESFALKSQFQRNVKGGSWLAGLGYSIPGLERFDTKISAGISGIPKSKLYVNSRSRLTVISTKNQLLHLSIKPFWTNRSGFGFTASEDFSLVLTDGILLRLLQVNTISERTRGLDWYAGLILYQQLDSQRGLAWQIFSNGQTDEAVPLFNYGAQVTYRTPVIKNKLNGEFRIGVGFPKVDPDEQRRSSGNVSINFILPFGRASKDVNN